jgi:tetratricopeptide (TPR) repeat protein
MAYRPHPLTTVLWSLAMLLALCAPGARAAGDGAGAAQGRPTAPQTPKASAHPAAKSAADDFSLQDFVIEHSLTTVRLENDGTGERDIVASIHVQNPAGVHQFSELVIGYDSARESISVDYLRIRKPDGSLARSRPAAVMDVTPSIVREATAYSDVREMRLTLAGLDPGDTIEYRIVTRITASAAPGEFWYEYTYNDTAICLDEKFAANLPKDRLIRLKTLSGAAPEIHVDGDRRIYSWSHKNLKHPPADAADGGVKPQASAQAKPASILFSTFQTWAQVAEWYEKLSPAAVAPSPEIQAQAAALTSGVSNPADKIAALYDFVGTQIRYIGVPLGRGSFAPASAKDTLANRYGDAKDKHALLAALLEAIGVHASAALIPIARAVNLDVPSPSQFDHLITAIPQGVAQNGAPGSSGASMWLDTTTGVGPFRYLTPNLRGRKALVVAANQFVVTPAALPFPAEQHVNVDAQISGLGKLTAHIRYTLRGDNEFALRTLFQQTPSSQWAELGKTMTELDGLNGNVTAVKPGDPLATHDPFVIDLEYSQVAFLDWKRKSARLVLPVPILSVPDAPEAPQAKEHATGPIALGNPLAVHLALRLSLPPNETAQAPVGLHVERSYADYTSSYHAEANLVTADRALRFIASELPAGSRDDLLAFSRAVESDEAQTITVQNSSGDTSVPPTSASASELVETAEASLDRNHSDDAIPLLERAIALDPKQPHAWSDLGLARLRQRNWTESITAFRRQLELDPHDATANRYIGLALMGAGQDADAETALRSQIERSPGDANSRASLGEVLLKEKKYAQAATELDKAAILAPGDPWTRIQLGAAYLHAGQNHDALTAFEKAVEVSPTPDVQSHIAALLADANQDLDPALKYAESAVATTEAAMRGITLDHPGRKDFSAVAVLDYGWQTLGWVHFQRGELETAEKYLHAAWQLDPNSEVSEHLGQLYEKRGKRELALEIYGTAAPATPEIHARLVALTGSEEDAGRHARDSAESFKKSVTFPLGKFNPPGTQADFLVLIASSATGATLESSAFLNGEQRLRPLGERLRTIHLKEIFPDAHLEKLLRRGTVSCSTEGDCSFLLQPVTEANQ